MSSEEELRIRELFHRLKEEDELSVPSISQTLEARRSSQPGARIWTLRLKAAAVLLVLMAIAIPVLIRQDWRSWEPDGQLTVDVLEWESPTDFLLTYSEESLLMTAPSIGVQTPYWAEEGVLEAFKSDGQADDS